MPNPSLLIVPARFKTGRLYSQIPSNTDNRGDFNVTRATTATRVNASGLIEVVASGIPRLDYFASGGVVGCPALLVEPGATNLFSGSADLGSTTYWTRPAGANITGNVSGIIAPDGTQTATLFQASGTTATNSRLRQTWSRTTTGAHAMSVFVRGFAGVAASGAVVCGVGASELNFAITSGGVVTLTSMTGGAAAVTSGIVNYGNGWYRITAVGTAATSGSTQSELYCSPSGGPQYYAWGAQIETGSVATSYIPTTTAPITRNADLISLSSVSGVIGQTEGTIYWEGSLGQIDKIFFSIGASTTQTIRLETTSNGFIQFGVISGTPQCAIATSGAITIEQFYKVAGAYKQNDFVFYINGQQVGFDNSGTIPTALAQMQFSSSATANLSIQRCRALALYTTRLTNAELAALTTL